MTTIRRLVLPKEIMSDYGRQFHGEHIETLCVPKEEWENKSLLPFFKNRCKYKSCFFTEAQIYNLELY